MDLFLDYLSFIITDLLIPFQLVVLLYYLIKYYKNKLE